MNYNYVFIFRAFYCQHYLSILTREHLSTSDIKRKYLEPIHEMKHQEFSQLGVGWVGNNKKTQTNYKRHGCENGSLSLHSSSYTTFY